MIKTGVEITSIQRTREYKKESIPYMPLKNRDDPLRAIENYQIPYMPLFIIFRPLRATAVKIQF